MTSMKSNSNDGPDDWELTDDVSIPDKELLVQTAPDPAIEGLSTTQTKLDLCWMKGLFPAKPEEKLLSWLQTFHDNEFETVESLKTLTPENWDKLRFPLAIESQIRAHLSDLDSKIVQTAGISDSTIFSLTAEPRPLSQIDCVVIDISSSMRARSKIDCDKTREDVSKILFHTLIDKLITLELSHAVGLLAFGSSLIPIGITTEYERFHDELGRLDANQHSTMLYDAVYAAAETIEEYNSTHILPFLSAEAASPLRKRIFVLTDGEDNSSKRAPWEVARFLQEAGITLDAIPLAGRTAVLQSVCSASGGLCFEVTSQEQGVNLFEREATLHLAFREAPAEVAPLVTSQESLKSLELTKPAAVLDIKSAVPSSVYAPVLSVEEVSRKAELEESKSSASSTSSDGSKSFVPGSVKRVLREYMQIAKNPVTGFSAFMSSEDSYQWKAIVSDLPAPYSGGTWLLTIQFPRDYPFKAPRVRFMTPIYHCNISVDGDICLDVLKGSWSPSFTISTILQSIRELILQPNGNDPLDAYKGANYRDYITEGKTQYFDDATAHTRAHASQSYDDLVATYHLG